MIRFTLSLVLVVWAVTSVPAQMIDSAFVPGGIDLSVNAHMAPIGPASRCVNFMFDNQDIVKREGYSWLSRSTDRDFTGIWTYIDDDGDKRLIGCAQNTANNYQSLYVSSEYSYDVGVTSLQDYIYLDETGTGAVYNGKFIFANGKNRPVVYNGTDFRPLVEVPPGSFDFAPEKPDASTAQVLKGKYFYGWQAAMPDSMNTNTLFWPHADSMNLDGPSWRVRADSDWVRVFSAPFTGPTVFVESSDSTISRLCRGRGGALSSDSMFRIDIVGYDSFDFDYSYIDSIPDESLNVKEYWYNDVAYFSESACPSGLENLCDSTRVSHPFVGFIDTVPHIVSDTIDARMDSTYKIGQPQLYSIDSLAYHYGISADDAYLGGEILYRSWRFCWYDSSTGMLTNPGPELWVPADSIDSIVTIITPVFDTTKPYWGILIRAEVLLVPVDSTVLTASALTDLGWSVSGEYGNNIYYYPIDGECREGDQSFIIGGNINELHCVAERIILGDSTHEVGAYHPVCTIKAVTGFCDTIADSFPVSALSKTRAVPLDQQTIGQWDNVCVLQDRILMSQGSIVYYNGFTGRGSEMAYWPIGNAVSVGTGDGDEVTAVHAGNDYVDIFEKYSWYQAKETGTNEFTVYEIKNNVGCIATNSVVDLPAGGLAFLSMNGFYIYAPAWQSEYKATGGNVNAMGKQVREHLDAMSFTQKSECYGWMTEDREVLIFSFPSLDTSLVVSEGQWSQWDFAPRMTAEYDISVYRYYGLLPCSGTVFIENDSDSLFRYGNVKTDKGDSVEALWKSLELFQTGGFGKIEEFKLWKYSNTDLGIDFNVWDIMDTAKVATIRDTAVVRVKRRQIACPESEGFKIEIKFKGDSLAIDRVDVGYTPTGPMPVE